MPIANALTIAVEPEALATVTLRYVAGTLSVNADVYPAVFATDVSVPVAPTGKLPAESMYRCTVTVSTLSARMAATAALKPSNENNPDDQVVPVGITTSIGFGGITLSV